MTEMNMLGELPISILLIILGGLFLIIGFSGELRIKGFIVIPPIAPTGRIIFVILGFILVFLGIYLIFSDLDKKNKAEIIIDEPKGEVFSTEEHVKITVEGRINNFTQEWRGSRIYILVKPLETEGFYTQHQFPAAEEWTAIAYLGGTGEYSAKHNEQFFIYAVLTENSLESRYNSLDELPEKNTVISEPVKLRVSRKRHP